MNRRIYLNDGWSFYREGEAGNAETVRLPHANAVLPFNYFSENTYQFVSVYEKTLNVPSDLSGKLLFLTFEGAAHKSTVYVNDKVVCEHNCGYTAFSVEISEFVKYGEDNTLKVVLDSRETLNIPPFGHVIDYLTYGGIYREVYIDVKDKLYVDDVFVKAINVYEENKSFSAEVVLKEKNTGYSGAQIYINIYDNENLLEEFGPFNSVVGENSFTLFSTRLKEWSVDSPNVYRMVVIAENGEYRDEYETGFGLRAIEFKKDGFYLNGEKLKIRGLNRHQSYPYVGYAMPQSVQEHDVYILKNELLVNAVRTSHYPQSKYFLDACDRLGLLVFTEAPGWQHIGNDEWKEQHLKNVEDMVLQNRNHPSIILWGVRVNESQDDNKLYKRANKIAHDLDPTRPTSGVRYLQMSNLLEDVYAFNDFSHTGDNPGLTKKFMVTPKAWKPYIVSEFNGHMFPTKSFDCEEHRLSHALRHANVLNSMYEPDNDVSGCFGWCMFDYNTHKDFGSGDKICYHGVMDMFRNPKLAAYVYASQSDASDVCEISSNMDIGEHPAGCLGNVYVFTNADYVELYKNNEFVKRFYPDREAYPNLPHPPIKVDDLIGCLLEVNEGLSKKSSDKIKQVVKAYMTKGMSGAITPSNALLLGSAVVKERMGLQKCFDIFYKYVGNWGSDMTVYRFDAYKNGKLVSSITKSPAQNVVIQTKVSHTDLVETSTYDAACINFSAVSDDGNLLNYCNDPIVLKATGAIELIGPSVVPLRGGMGGTYVKTKGRNGKGKLTVTHERFGTTEIEFHVKIKRD